ncbi:MULTISPECIES: histidine phosphatase family protein [Flavobacterium]|uniref:SixA phosphatase family protein n=1 Tax=Flavobacterium TaxID=237 RepID=UPI000963640F|nr:MULTISPECIES: histidine phosphatase family protein [Flavobacterium]MBN9284557.1 histidine phosphatase family protein [Flavobacterium sp.]OJV72851.1 MAG: histidine phosphatase family protein [Flavobacterium sp. 40-81]
MKNLILIRHAKSSWDTPSRDIDRPISKRGINDANIIFSQVTKFLPKTFLVWCSVAKRAKETAMIFSQNISIPYENVILKDDLYTFDGKNLESVIKKCENRFDSLILFGHNEAITDFVNKFGDLYIENVPTAGFVSISFEQDSWDSIHKGKTIKTLFPRQLKV